MCECINKTVTHATKQKSSTKNIRELSILGSTKNINQVR